MRETQKGFAAVPLLSGIFVISVKNGAKTAIPYTGTTPPSFEDLLKFVVEYVFHLPSFFLFILFSYLPAIFLTLSFYYFPHSYILETEPHITTSRYIL